jgi:hypothetical protein
LKVEVSLAKLHHSGNPAPKFTLFFRPQGISLRANFGWLTDQMTKQINSIGPDETSVAWAYV